MAVSIGALTHASTASTEMDAATVDALPSRAAARPPVGSLPGAEMVARLARHTANLRWGNS